MIRKLVKELIEAADDVGPGANVRQKTALLGLAIYGGELFERAVVAVERIAAAQDRARPSPEVLQNQPGIRQD